MGGLESYNWHGDLEFEEIYFKEIKKQPSHKNVKRNYDEGYGNPRIYKLFCSFNYN